MKLKLLLGLRGTAPTFLESMINSVVLLAASDEGAEDKMC